MKILMLVFGRRDEGTFFRAFPWARHLAAQGHHATLMCVSPASRLRTRTQMRDGVRIIETPSLLDGRGLMRKLCGMSGWGPLDILARVREIRRGHYDVVHVFEHHANVALPVYLTGRRHVPVLVADWCDNYGADGFRAHRVRPRLELLYRLVGAPVRAWTDFVEGDLRRRADGVTVISRCLRDRAIARGVAPNRIAWIAGGAEVESVQPLPSRVARLDLGLPADQPLAVFFGAAQFDMDLALEAFGLVIAARPDASLCLVGPADPVVSRQIGARGLSAHVRQTGWVKEGSLSAWLASADVCVLPLRDTPVNQARWPNKIGFYMAAARPTVCTAVGDVADLVREERIGLVSATTAASFAAQILRLLDDRVLAAEMGARARVVAERRFASDALGRALEGAYACFAARRPLPSGSGPAPAPALGPVTGTC